MKQCLILTLAVFFVFAILVFTEVQADESSIQELKYEIKFLKERIAERE